MNQCRACRGTNLFLFLALGDHAPGNAFVFPHDAGVIDVACPLDTYVCLDCALIEIPDRLPKNFYGHYLYTPAGADGLRAHFARAADDLAAMTDGLVVDIGCNVGLLLDECRSRGLRVVGIDPAENLTGAPRGRGHDVITAYFGRETAAEVRARFGPASIVITTNTFNHIDDLHEFVGAARDLLADDGRFVVEVPHSADLLEKNEFDTVYQEHLSEFSVRSFDALFRATGFELIDVTELGVHGGSMRITAQKSGGPHAITAHVKAWLDAETQRGLFERATYDAFRARVEANRSTLVAMIASLRAEGAKIAGYGAPAKGNTLLTYCGFGPTDIAWIADRNELKHGRLTPDSHIPVVPVARVLQDQPDYLLVLAWNYTDEIVRQQAEYARRGGRFIIPIPEPRILAGAPETGAESPRLT